MVRWSGREIATSVLWCAVAEPRKKGGERLTSAFGRQLSYHLIAIVPSLYIILLQRSCSRKLSCSATRAWDRVMARHGVRVLYQYKGGAVLGCTTKSRAHPGRRCPFESMA